MKTSNIETRTKIKMVDRVRWFCHAPRVWKLSFPPVEYEPMKNISKKGKKKMSNWKLMAVLCNWALKFLYWEKHNKLMTMPNTMNKWNGGAETEAMLFPFHPCFNSVPLLLDSILFLFFFNLFYSPTSCKLYLLLNWWDEMSFVTSHISLVLAYSLCVISIFASSYGSSYFSS